MVFRHNYQDVTFQQLSVRPGQLLESTCQCGIIPSSLLIDGREIALKGPQILVLQARLQKIVKSKRRH
jgi:hypothetical protein